MERSVLCQAFVLGCGFFLLSDAAISLNFIENSGTNLECGTSVVLMCEIQPYGNSLTWKVDGVIAAQCGSTSASCISNPAFSRYTFSYDISSGTFNLTIATVGLSDDGIDFTCEDGTNFVTKSASTIVPFDANSCSVTPTVGSSSVTVEATTSCVYPASEVEIQWYYFESIGGPENEMTESDFSYTSSKNEDNSSCTSGACTSGNGVTTVVENAVFDIQSTGTEVYIQARFVQFSKSELKNTTKKYKIKKAGPDPYKCPGLGEHKATDTKAKCVCAWLGIFCAILLCLFIIGIIVEYNKEIWDDDEIPFFLWILLFIIIVGFGILALAKIRNRAAMEDKRPEEQPMTETKTDV